MSTELKNVKVSLLLHFSSHHRSLDALTLLSFVQQLHCTPCSPSAIARLHLLEKINSHVFDHPYRLPHLRTWRAHPPYPRGCWHPLRGEQRHCRLFLDQDGLRGVPFQPAAPSRGEYRLFSSTFGRESGFVRARGLTSTLNPTRFLMKSLPYNVPRSRRDR
jgi:hypothetical protein